MGSENDNAQRDRDRSRRGDRPSRFSDAQRDRSQDKSDCKRLLVSNIPYEYRWTELKDLFKDRVGDVAFVELFNDENGKPRGCGVVEFSNADACKKALTVMHRYELNGRKLVLKEDPASNHGRRTGNRDRGGARGRDDKDRSYDRVPDNFNDANDPDRFNLYGLSTQFLDSINVQPPLVKKVFVANLDYKADRAKIKEIFKMAGKVRNIDLAVDKDGNSRGFAVVEFDHPVEAVQAISMFDKQMLFERRMTVRMDRASSDKPAELKLPEGLKSIGFGLGPNGDPLRDVARNLPQMQPQNSNMGMSNTTGGLGNSVLGNVPTAGVALNGLGGGIGSGLNANAALSGSLGLQALGLTGLGALQSQLLTQGLAANDLTANIASALQAQGLSANLGGLGNDLASANSLASTNLNASSVLGSSSLNNSSLNSRQGNSIPQSSSYGRQNNIGSNASGGGRGASSVGGSFQRESATVSRDNKISDMVVITNLPPTVTWQLIREKFSECGDVKFAEMTGSDTAIVRFHKEWDAERAVKMFDRTRIDGRTIDVRFF